MKILNRGFISVKPTALFLTWKSNISEEEVFDTIIPESTIFLIEDDFWEDEAMIKKYFKKIAKQEFFSVCDNKNEWPKINNEDDFNKYFIAECGTFVVDLLKNPIDGDLIEL